LERERMALSPRSSLPSSLSASSSAAAVTPTPAAPVVQPPAAPALADCSSPMSPGHEGLVLYAVDEDPEHPIADHGSDSSTPGPALPTPDQPEREPVQPIPDPGLPIPDPPTREPGPSHPAPPLPPEHRLPIPDPEPRQPLQPGMSF